MGVFYGFFGQNGAKNETVIALCLKFPFFMPEIKSFPNGYGRLCRLDEFARTF
jgi:hypothetical protein